MLMIKSTQVGFFIVIAKKWCGCGMINIVKKKINMSDELKAKINWSCNFNKMSYQIIDGYLRILEHTI